MPFVPKKKEEKPLGFVPLKKQSIETERLTEEEPSHGYIGEYMGSHIIQEAGTGQWYRMDETGYTIIPESKKSQIKESEIIKGGVAPTYFDPTMAIGAGAGMGARMAVKGVSGLVTKTAIKAGVRAGAVSGLADVPAGIGAEVIAEGKYPEYALPFSILVGMGSEAALRKILSARAAKLGLSNKDVDEVIKNIDKVPKKPEQKLLMNNLTNEEVKLLPPGQGFELVEKAEALRRLKELPIEKQVRKFIPKKAVEPRKAPVQLPEATKVDLPIQPPKFVPKKAVPKDTTLYAGIPVTPENLRHASPAIIGSAAGFETDEEGRLSYNPAKGLSVAAGLYGYTRIPYKGKTMAERVTAKGVSALDKLFKTRYLKAFHPKAGLEEELYGIKKAARTEERALRHKSFQLTNKLIKSFTPEERAMISDVIEKEGDFLKASERIKEQAEIVKKWNNQIGDKLEDLGLIDRSKLRVDKDKYIHRVYQRKVSDKVKYFGKSAMDRMRGGYTVPRGELKHAKVGTNWKKGDEVYSVLSENGKISYVNKSNYKPSQGSILKRWRYEGLETVGKKKGHGRLHRDYTKGERQSMGEVRDVAIRQGIYFQEVAHDMAFANMIKKLEVNPDWVSKTPKEGWAKIPEAKISGQVNKFGSLGGKYVNPEVKRLLNEVKVPWKNTGNKELDAVFSGYRQAMSAWKLGKTALNPTVHFNNFVSNISMSFLDGRNPANIIYKGAKELKNKGTYFNEAVENGLLDSNLIKGDIDVDNILSKLEGITAEPVNQKGWGKLLSSMFSPIKKVGKAHIRAYEAEDEIFKLGVYISERNKGLSPEQAMGKANELFFDYSDIPIGVQAIRDFGIVPFITYTYKALPVVAKKYAEAPHRVLALYLGASALNDYAYRNIYGRDALQQERSERGVLPEYMKGAGPPGIGFAPKSIRMPWQGKEGESEFLDISRIAPGGDVLYQANPGYEYGLALGQNPLLLTAIALATNKDPYFGKKIRPFEDPISESQKDANRNAEISYIANQSFPNHPALPGSWSFNKVANAMTNEGLIDKNVANRMGWTGKDFAGRESSTAKALLSSFGMKVRPVNPKESLKFMKLDLLKQAKEAQKYYSKIKRNKASTEYEISEAKRILDDTVNEIKRVNKELNTFKGGLHAKE